MAVKTERERERERERETERDRDRETEVIVHPLISELLTIKTKLQQSFNCHFPGQSG